MKHKIIDGKCAYCGEAARLSFGLCETCSHMLDEWSESQIDWAAAYPELASEEELSVTSTQQ